MIILSYIFLFIGFFFSSEKFFKINGLAHKSFFDDSRFSISKIQKVSFFVFIVLSIFEIAFQIPKFVYALRYGYKSLYTTFSASVWLSRLPLATSAAFFIGLSAKPGKKRAMMYFVLGVINPIIVFLQGERGSLVTYVLFATFYLFCYANMFEGSQKVNNSKIIKLMVVAVIIVMGGLPFLYSYGESRSMSGTSIINPITGILNFFESQGGSFRIVGAAVKYKGDLPQNLYSFGAILDRFSDKVYIGQTEYRAINSHSFADIITYKEEGPSYLMGYGMGSSYIAELYYDFGYLGIVISNFFVGVFLSRLNSFSKQTIFGRAIMFMTFSYMLIMPRSSFLRPLDALLSLSSVIIFVFIYLCSSEIVLTRR